MMEKTPVKAEKYSALKTVTNYIENQIVQKALRPGDRVPTETELCQLLNVSRGSVREAIKVLEANGVINIRRGDGTYVSQPEDIPFSVPLTYRILLSEAMPKQILEFREEIELAILRLAVKNADEEDMKAIHARQDEFRNCIDMAETDPERLAKVDGDFHRAVAKAGKNTYLEEIYLFTLEIFLPFISENYIKGQHPSESVKAHQKMIDALDNRSLEMAQEAITFMVGTWGNWAFKTK